MRLLACTLSAVLLSGCSWLGSGGSNSSSYGYNSGQGCYGAAGYGQGGGQYGFTGGQYGGGACGAAGGYSVAGGTGYGGGYGQGAGYGAAGYGQGAGYGAAGYGQGAGYGGGYGQGVGMGALGLRGVQGAGSAQYGYGQSGYGASQGTVLGANAGYGSALSGGQYAQSGATTATGGQWINGQWVMDGAQYAGQSVTTVQGSPIYVPQPYPAYYGVASGGGYYAGGSGGGALPFGFEAGIGTDIAIGGDIFGAKPGGAALGSSTRHVSASEPIAYADAYKNGVNYDFATTYDVNPSTTLIGRVGYSKAEGKRVQVGNVTDSTFAGVNEPYYAKWSDLKEVSLEGGVRKYMGGWNNQMSGIRPYAQATAGFTHNDAVSVTQDSATIIQPEETQHFIDAGWTPTASGAIGAEMQIGPRSAIGVEAGIRWRDDLNTNTPSDDRWSVPIKLRGRVSF